MFFRFKVRAFWQYFTDDVGWFETVRVKFDAESFEGFGLFTSLLQSLVVLAHGVYRACELSNDDKVLEYQSGNGCLLPTERSALSTGELYSRFGEVIDSERYL